MRSYIPSTVRGLALAGLFFHVGCDGWHGGRLTKTPSDDGESDAGSTGDDPLKPPVVTLTGPGQVQSGDSASFESTCDADPPNHRWTLDGAAQATSDSVFTVRLVIPGNHVVGYSCADAQGQLTSAGDHNVLVTAGLTLAYQTALDQPGGSELYAVPMVDPTQRYKLSPALPAAGADVREVGYSRDDTWLYHLSNVGGGRFELSFRLRSGGASHVVSSGVDGEVSPPRFSADARYVAFETGELATGDTPAGSTSVRLVDLSLQPPSVTNLGEGSLVSPESWSSAAGALAIATASSLRVHWPAMPKRDASVPLPVPGLPSKVMLSPDGEHVAFVLENDKTRRVFGAATDGTPAKELVCPEGPTSDLSLVTNDRVLVLCDDGVAPGVAALSDWDSSNWLTLRRGLVPDARCGELQILTDGSGLYALSLASPQWTALRLISGPLVDGVSYAKGSTFARDCSSLFYLDQSGAQAFRVRFDEALSSSPAEPVTLPGPTGWQNARLWPSPQGASLLLSGSDTLAIASWQGAAQAQRAEPNLVVQAGAGWLDEKTMVIQGASSLTASSSLLKLVYQDQTLSQSAVLDEQLGNSDKIEANPRFALSADAGSLLLIANSAPRKAEPLQALGSGEIPLQVKLAAEVSLEPLIAKPTIALGKVQQVLPLGQRALAFTAAVDEQWESVLYVHDMTSAYRVSPVDKVARRLSALASSADGRAAAFAQSGPATELLRAPVNLAMSLPKVAAAERSFAEGGMFTGDGRWFLARPSDSASGLMAVDVDTGALIPLGAPAADETQPFAVSPRDGGVAVVAAIGPGERGLYFVNPSVDAAKRRLLAPLPALADAPLAVWFSDDGSQLAYVSPTPDGATHELWMWKVGSDEPALRRSFASAAPGPRHRGVEASALRGGHGLLFYPASQDNLARREAWVVPWLGQEAEAWRVPSSAPIRACHQVANNAELVVDTAAGPIERVIHYKIGSPKPLATLFEDTTSYDSVTSLQLSSTGTHFVFQMLLRNATYLARVDVAEKAVEITPPRTRVPPPRFSPDGQYLLMETSDTDSDKQLYFLHVERPAERTELDTKGNAVAGAYWVQPTTP